MPDNATKHNAMQMIKCNTIHLFFNRLPHVDVSLLCGSTILLLGYCKAWHYSWPYGGSMLAIYKIDGGSQHWLGRTKDFDNSTESAAPLSIQQFRKMTLS